MDNIVNKIIEYEKEPRISNLLLTGGVSILEQGDSEYQGDFVYNSAIEKNWSGDRIKFYDTCLPNGYKRMNQTELETELSKGYSFFHFSAHGMPTYWLLQSSNFPASLTGYYNNSGHTIITTSSCLTNAFDTFPGDGERDPCLSEAFIRNYNTGVVAYVGCSRETWRPYDKDAIWGATNFITSFYKYLFEKSPAVKNFGKIVAMTKMDYIQESMNIDNTYKWYQFGFNPIGDPEMPVYIDFPRHFGDLQMTSSNNRITLGVGLDDVNICIQGFEKDKRTLYRLDSKCYSVSYDHVPEFSILTLSKQNYATKQYRLWLLQNMIISGSYYEGDIIRLGSEVNPTADVGEINIKGNAKFKASEIYVESGVTIERGSHVEFLNK